MAVPAAADTTAPTAKLSGKKKQKAGKTIVVTVSSNEAGTITATGKLTVPNTSKVYKLKKVTKTITAGGKVKLKLKVGKKARKAAKAALADDLKVKASLTVVAADASGNKTTKKRKVRLKLP